MEPRLSKSKKWTSLPSELTEQIIDILSQNFANQAQSGDFLVEGRIYSGELLVLLGYLEQDRLKQCNFEISIDYNRNKDNVLNLVHLALDCGGSLMDQLFETENDGDLPRQWQEFKVTGKSVFIRFSTTNTDLEKQADQLLGIDDESLVKDEDDEEKISILGLDEEE